MSEITNNDILLISLFFGIGIIGGGFKYLNTNSKVKWYVLIREILTGAFTSTILGIITKESTSFSPLMLFALAGIYGFGGIAILNFAVEAIKNKLLSGKEKQGDESINE